MLISCYFNDFIRSLESQLKVEKIWPTTQILKSKKIRKLGYPRSSFFIKNLKVIIFYTLTNVSWWSHQLYFAQI